MLELDDDFYQGDRGNWGLVNAQLYAMRDSRRSRGVRRLGAARPRALHPEAPDDAQLHALRGLALAFLGRREDALREGERAVELLPIERDAYFGPYLQLLLARVHMMVGSKDKAVELLEPLIEVPNSLSRAWCGWIRRSTPCGVTPGSRRWWGALPSGAGRPSAEFPVRPLSYRT